MREEQTPLRRRKGREKPRVKYDDERKKERERERQVENERKRTMLMKRDRLILNYYYRSV
jgi:hypothetical protein